MYRLRELERKDVKRINKWRNDPDLITYLGAPYRFINEDVESNWYENYICSRHNSVRCVIVDDKSDSDVYGLISLMEISNINRSAVMHIMIGEKENRGKGIGTFEVRAMIAHAFQNLNLRRVELGVLENNIPAIRLYEKCGFVQEGVKRQSNYKNGQYLSMIIMSLLRQEWDFAEAQNSV